MIKDDGKKMGKGKNVARLSLHLAAACWSMLTIIITILVRFSPPPPQQPPPPLPPPSLQRPQLLGCLRSSDRKYKCPPTYLLIGFPKAGTPSLFRWLAQDPRVLLYRNGMKKEAHFWHRPTPLVKSGLADYIRSFPSLRVQEHGDVIIGERL